MSTFVASNGIPVTLTKEGCLIVENSDHPYPATVAAGGDVVALREFFQHERDEELERWRWPYEGNRNMVVYSVVENSARVVDETTGEAQIWRRGEEVERFHSAHDAAAFAYFTAHPERKTWHDAKEGEVWLVNYEGRVFPSIFQADRFRDHAGSWDAASIIDARKIWPEEVSS